MKKLIPAVAILFLSLSLSAQYKKAGFFEKKGRTYELGTQYYMMGDNGNSLGYKIGFGRDKDGKRLFSNWELQYIPSHEYSYTAPDGAGSPVTIKGNSTSTWVYNVNYNFHLLKNEAEDKHMIQPFVGAGFNILVYSGIKDETRYPETYNYTTGTRTQYTSEGSFSVGLHGGAGCLVNFTPSLSLKLQGGYSHQFNLTSTVPDEVKSFYVFDSFSYVSLGVRFRFVRE